MHGFLYWILKYLSFGIYKIKVDKIMKTGYKVSINNQSSTEVLVVIIKGDTSGDGEINALDLLQVVKYISGSYTLEGAYKEAADTSGDNEINALDVLQIVKNISGSYQIIQ